VDDRCLSKSCGVDNFPFVKEGMYCQINGKLVVYNVKGAYLLMASKFKCRMKAAASRLHPSINKMLVFETGLV
jgi:hypothetical protein